MPFIIFGLYPLGTLTGGAQIGVPIFTIGALNVLEPERVYAGGGWERMYCDNGMRVNCRGILVSGVTVLVRIGGDEYGAGCGLNWDTDCNGWYTLENDDAGIDGYSTEFEATGNDASPGGVRNDWVFCLKLEVFKGTAIGLSGGKGGGGVFHFAGEDETGAADISWDGCIIWDGCIRGDDECTSAGGGWITVAFCGNW